LPLCHAGVLRKQVKEEKERKYKGKERQGAQILQPPAGASLSRPDIL
jgi:hypothetical protein